MKFSFKVRKLSLACMLGCLLSSFSFSADLPPAQQIDSNSDKISFYFQNIEIKTLLQLIAKNSGLNFIISDAIKGNTTLNLRNVTWQQALNIVMQAHGLTARREGNVMYVSTIEEITSNESKQLQSDQQLSNLAPIESTIVQLKYANAKDLADFVKGQGGSLLTARGQIAADVRTNSLIIRDIKTNLTDLTQAIHHLDVPAKQVLIEARIVNLDTTYEQNLGVQFGLNSPRNISGTLAGANLIAQHAGVGGVPLAQRLNFINPAAGATSGANAGTIGMALAKIGGVFLDLELSAIEEEGHGQVIASPHVVTSNLQKAVIETGEEIPYQEATSSGATSIEFKKAVLSLEITPQITPDNKIILHMKATDDTQGQQLQISQGTTAGAAPVLGPPIINSQDVESNVLLNNNETIVIGGIYKQTKQNTVDRIPFLGSLPMVGYLFRKSAVTNDRSELLIFVTPKIINPLATQAAKNSKTALPEKVIYKTMES